MKPSVPVKLVLSSAVTFAAPLIASIFTRPAQFDWYAGLNKPFFTPPDWLFGPVWTVLYLLMAVAAFLVWQKGLTHPLVRIALALYLLQLILNALWTPLFFAARLPLVAFIEILLLWLAILLTILAFARLSKLAALLLLPYILWTSFAALLNGAIYLLNR
jgi:benzodiazapine receptor